MYIIEFERKRNGKPDIAVRILNSTTEIGEEPIIAEAVFVDGLPDGLSLKDDVPFAALRLRKTS